MPCFPSLARAEKNTSALQGRWLEEPEGFPIHVSFRKGNKRVVTTPQGKQNGHYGRRKGNKTALWPPHGEQKGRYAPVGVSPSAPSGLVPLRGGTVHSCRL